ncbi:MAG TPA: DUF2247 family protein [Candidatus Babeliales bacterium]|jgi:hypothetical protein|nr:DUF2247 family protein [Candidatus Babeliales bacterium]
MLIYHVILRILGQNNIPYSWNTLRVGKKYNLIDNTQIADYAAEYLSDHPHETNQYIAELVSCDETKSINDILEKVADIFDGKIDCDDAKWELEKRKLRFCILTYLKQHTSDERELLDKIAQVYDDFGFPKDMENFIYYMPAKDFNPLEHSKEECTERLMGLFKDFLSDEKRFLAGNK